MNTFGERFVYVKSTSPNISFGWSGATQRTPYGNASLRESLLPPRRSSRRESWITYSHWTPTLHQPTAAPLMGWTGSQFTTKTTQYETSFPRFPGPPLRGCGGTPGCQGSSWIGCWVPMRSSWTTFEPGIM